MTHPQPAQREDAEQQVAEHLGMAALPHIARAERILEAAIDPLTRLAKRSEFICEKQEKIALNVRPGS